MHQDQIDAERLDRANGLSYMYLHVNVEVHGKLFVNLTFVQLDTCL